jgi:HPt (histidine-containing phosphotransfer) domain-containing protein
VALAYLQEVPRLLSQLADAIATQNAPQAKISAHTIKGSLRTLGAKCQATAGSLEAASNAAQWSECLPMLETLRLELAEVEEELRGHLR